METHPPPFPGNIPDLSGQCDEYRRPQLLSGSRSSFRGTGIREAGRARSRTHVLQTLPALQHGLVSYVSKGTFPVPGTLLPGRNRRQTFPPHFRLQELPNESQQLKAKDEAYGIKNEV